MTRPLYMPIRRVGLRVENGAGWSVVCNQCSERTILMAGSLRVRVPYVCAICSPGQVVQGGEPDAREMAAECDREAEQSEKSARESRRLASKLARDGFPALAERNRVAAQKAADYAADLRLKAEAWRRVTSERRTG